jgi:hypothetical protein
LLPVKAHFRDQFGGQLNEDGEKCINAEEIIHNGIIYTPKQDLRDDYVYSVFEVILLPPKNNQIDF